MKIYKFPEFKEPIYDPIISVKSDESGLPIIYGIQPTAKEVTLWIILTMPDGLNKKNVMLDGIKVDVLNYDPAGTAGKLAIRLLDFEITEEEAAEIEATLLP